MASARIIHEFIPYYNENTLSFIYIKTKMIFMTIFVYPFP